MKDIDPEVLLKKAEKLVQAGKPDAAIALVEAGIADTWYPGTLHEWLGRRELRNGGDPVKALARLKQARSSGGWSRAIPELGMAYDLLNMDMEAYYEFDHVVDEDNTSKADRCYARFRQGAILERRHLPRLALTAYRKLMRIKGADADTRAKNQASALALEERLTVERKYFPHQADEMVWLRTHRGRLGDQAPTFAEFLDMAADLETFLVASDARPALHLILGQMIAVVRAGALAPEQANVRFDQGLSTEKHAVRIRWRAVATPFARLHHLLYNELLDREEWRTWGVPDTTGPCLASDDPEEAWARLENPQGRDGFENLLGYSGHLENAGDMARLRGKPGMALRHYALALIGCQYYASTATGAGEGMARMIDVNRLQAKHDQAARTPLPG